MLYVLTDLKCSHRQNASIPAVEVWSRPSMQGAGNEWTGAGKGFLSVLLFPFFIWVLVMWDGPLGTLIKFMARVLFLHACHISLRCFENYSSPSDGSMEKISAGVWLALLPPRDGLTFCGPGRVSVPGSDASVSLVLNDFCFLVFILMVAIYIWPSVQVFHLW